MAQSPRSVSSPHIDSESFDAPQRRSSTSSSDTTEQSGDAPVMPLTADTSTDNVKSHALNTSDARAAATQVPLLDTNKQHDDVNSLTSASSTAASPPAKKPLVLSALPPVTALAVYNTFSFGEVMSPRHAGVNGKRYLGGYLQHRVAIAGGFLKSWKRKYFRLRDHGIVCYRQSDDAAPLFEIRFTAHSTLQLGKLSTTKTTDAAAMRPPLMSPSHSKSANAFELSSPRASAPAPASIAVSPASSATTTAKPSSASLVLILVDVDVVGHQTPAAKVDVPLYLRAETAGEFTHWVESLRLKIDARRRALALASVHAAMDDDHSTVAIEEATGASVEAVDSSNDAATMKASDSIAADAETTPQDVMPTFTDAASESDAVTPAVVATELPAFRTFATKYLLMKEIGEGSFSIVHRAVNRLTGSLCAVKCCKASPALDEEVRILRQLSHPNIVGVDDFYLEDDSTSNMCFVVMDLMEDGDLCDRLIARQRLPEREVQVIIAQVLQGLAYLHSHNVLHRDLKPENILLHGDAVKIADFGLAKQLPTATSTLTRSCGTLEYAAPELLTGSPYGLKSDVFSLGVVLYVLLFGAFPFSIESAAALQQMDQFHADGVDVRDMSCLSRTNVQWRSVSADAQDAILQMLAPRECDRVSAHDLLVHPWFDPDGIAAAPVMPAPAKTTAKTTTRTSGQRQQRRDSVTWQLLARSAANHECARLVDCATRGFRELLGRGLEVTKVGYKSTTAPHATTLTIDFVKRELAWTARRVAGSLSIGSTTGKSTKSRSRSNSSNARSRSICLDDVTEIRRGHATDAFLQPAASTAAGAAGTAAAARARDARPPAERCLSVVCAWRTLDIVVAAASQREFLVNGLLELITSNSTSAAAAPASAQGHDKDDSAAPTSSNAKPSDCVRV